MNTRKSLMMTGFYILLAFLFAGYIYVDMGSAKAIQFTTVFALEKLLSMDNLLVMFLIFQYFAINDPKEQKKALTLGIIGAVVFRTALILPGAYVVNHLTPVLYACAAFLIYSGYKICTSDDDGFDADDSSVIMWCTNNLGDKSKLFAAIVAVELCDIMFAVDSIPASFGVTQDPFIILTANLFAVLGLRALYFAVSNGLSIMSGIEKYIGAILVLVGLNVFCNHFWIKIPEWYLMGSVVVILCLGFIMCNKKEKEHGKAA